MSHASPHYADWRSLSAIEIWEVAALIHGVDPRALTDAVVSDPLDPSNLHGVPIDTSWEEKMLISAVQAQVVLSSPLNIGFPDARTKVNKASLIAWLRAQGYSDLADELDGGPVTASEGNPSGDQKLPEPERRLAALYALKGTSRWWQQRWRFTKIKELVAQEKTAGHTRSDEKTIRKDLKEAAQAESMKKIRAESS